MLFPSSVGSRTSLARLRSCSASGSSPGRQVPDAATNTTLGRMLADRDSLLRRLHELRSEHRDLDTVITRLGESGADALQLQRLKKRKLKLKDEITWLESRLIPDVIA